MVAFIVPQNFRVVDEVNTYELLNLSSYNLMRLPPFLIRIGYESEAYCAMLDVLPLVTNALGLKALKGYLKQDYQQQ